MANLNNVEMTHSVLPASAQQQQEGLPHEMVPMVPGGFWLVLNNPIGPDTTADWLTVSTGKTARIPLAAYLTRDTRLSVDGFTLQMGFAACAGIPQKYVTRIKRLHVVLGEHIEAVLINEAQALRQFIGIAVLIGGRPDGIQ